MPTASITSARTGQTFDVDFEKEPTPEDIDEVTSAWDTQFYQREGLDPSIAEQSPAGTVLNQVRNVGPGLVGGLMAQGGRVLDAGAKLVEQGLVGVFGANDFTRSGGGFQYVANVGDRLIEAGQELRPTNPANPIANTIGSGLQQAAGLVATMGAAAPFVGSKAALTTVPLVQGAIMGGGEGVQTARDLGIESPAGQLATGAAFAGAEVLTERLGGVGNTAATEALQAGLKTGLKQAAKTMTGEAIEEPLAGAAQDAVTYTAGQFVADPDRPGYTVTGMKLPALDAEFMQRRKLEAIGGAAGGAVFGGLQLASSGQPKARINEPVSNQQEAAVSEDLGELTAADVADLETPPADPETAVVKDSFTTQPRAPLQPILGNVPDAVPAALNAPAPAPEFNESANIQEPEATVKQDLQVQPETSFQNGPGITTAEPGAPASVVPEPVAEKPVREMSREEFNAGMAARVKEATKQEGMLPDVQTPRASVSPTPGLAADEAAGVAVPSQGQALSYDDLVKMTYEGQEASRKFNDLTPNDRQTVAAFAATRLPATDRNIQKTLKDIGITGAVARAVAAVKKGLPLYQKIEAWKQAEAELSKRQRGQQEEAKAKAKAEKKAAKAPPQMPEVKTGQWIVDANGFTGPVIGFEDGVPVMGLEGENVGDVEPQKAAAPWRVDPSGNAGFKNLDTSGTTAGFVNAQILAEAEALIRDGFTDFANWSRAMITRFGQAIREYLQGIWEQVVVALPNDAAKNMRLGAKAKDAPVAVAQGGFVMGETRSRFASPDQQERLYQVREDVTVKAAAEAWLDSLPMADAVAAMEEGRLPAGMTGDVAQHAAGLLIQRTTDMMKSGSEPVQMQARALGHRISKVWQGWLSQEAGRNLRQRSVVNSELTPYAPILAAEGMLIDRADAVMDQRFEGGAAGGATKVNDTADKAGGEASDSLADDLEGDTPERKAEKQKVRKQMSPAKKKLNKAQRTADRILQQLSERYADPPLMDVNGQRKVDPVRALYMQHVKAPMLEAEFVRQMVALEVPEGLAGTLWEASRLEIEARETLRLMAEAERAAAKDAREIEVAENRASRLIYRTEERLRQGSKDLSRSTDGDSINKVFRDKVKDDIGWEVFRDRLAKLRVGEEIAARLWRTAERERLDQAAMVRFREQRKADAVRAGILAAGSPKLRQMLNELRKKIAPDMTWADIFMELPASQKERQREIYRRLMLDERLSGLSKEERLALTNELDKAWQQERRKVFLRELERVGIGEKAAADKVKVVKALPKLIRLINLGMMNSEMFREAIAPEYGLKQITTPQALALRKLAEEAYDLPEGVLRSRKLAALLDGIQKSTGTSLPEVLNQYWVAAVLSGMRTQFDTFMSVTNGFGNQLLQSGMLALKNGNRAASVVSMMEWWRGLKQAFPEAMQILSKGDYSYLKRFNEDLKKALEGESTFRPVPLGEALWRDGNAMEKYGFAPVMIFTGRLMAAADHLNNSATTAGAKVVARALHPEFYKAVAPTQAERDAALVQARREVTGGAMPATAQERATVAARAREILNGQMRPEEVREASFMGDQAAYQNDPVGVFGAIYRAVNQGLGSLERGLQTYADEQGNDGPAGKYARGLMLFLSGAMRSMMGAKFIRFGANFGNDMLGFVPGTVLVSPALLGTEATRSQQQLLLGKNVFGLMAGLTVAAMFLGKDDEEDGWHLEGPWTDLTPEEIKQRRAAGFEPLTFWNRDGDKLRRVSYKQWPTAGLLAGVAHMQDRQRFRPEKWAQEGMAGHLLAAASVGAFQVKDVSAMRGLAELLGSKKFGSNPEEAFVEQMAKVPVNFAGGFIPTLAKDLDALADPQRYKPESVLEEFLRNVPVLRQRVAGGRPEINILGVPIEQDRKPWSRAYTEAENGVAHVRLAKLIARGFTLPTPETNRKVWKSGAWTTIAALGADAEWRYQKKVGDGYRAWLSSPQAAELLTNPDGLAVQRQINRQADAIKMQAVAEVVK